MLFGLKPIIIIASLTVLVSACSKNMPANEPQPDNRNSAPVAEQSNMNKASIASSQPQKTARPETKQGTIGLEGNQEKMTFKLFDSSKNSLSVPFTTYVPEDMVPQAARTDAGDSVTFFADFGGKRNPDAHLQIHIYPEGVREEAARGIVGLLAKRRKTGAAVRDAPKRFKWSLAEHDFMNQTNSGGWLMGTVALGRHNDRHFYVIIQYPEDFEEGFVPRAYRVLDEWRWGDTDTGL